MTPNEFCYWLMGYMELSENTDGFNEKQTQTLKNHLNMCFIHMVKEDGTLEDEKEIYEAIDRFDFHGKTSINC